jgi:hypothetical protein
MVRDTTDRDGGTLALSAGAWEAFTTKIKNALRGDPIGGEHLHGMLALFACSVRLGGVKRRRSSPSVLRTADP